MKLVLNTTSVALWHQVVHEAEASCAIVLQEELESYLVFLLMRFMRRPDFSDQIMAPDFLTALKLSPKEQSGALQEVGDKCLIYSGLFPKMAERRLVNISYFVNLGRSAYATISHTGNDLYAALSKDFVCLMDILQSVRHYSDERPDLLPLQAYELWQETGSQRAYSILTQHSTSIPLALDFKDKFFKS